MKGRRIGEGSARIVECLRLPLANPDFAPFLQRARDLAPIPCYPPLPTWAVQKVGGAWATPGVTPTQARRQPPRMASKKIFG
jgi:hypothetical protein